GAQAQRRPQAVRAQAQGAGEVDEAGEIVVARALCVRGSYGSTRGAAQSPSPSASLATPVPTSPVSTAAGSTSMTTMPLVPPSESPPRSSASSSARSIAAESGSSEKRPTLNDMPSP